MTTAETCSLIKTAYATRRIAMVALGVLADQRRGICRHACGFDMNAPAADRAIATKRAKALLDLLVKGKASDDDVVKAAAIRVRENVGMLTASMRPLEERKAHAEKQMIALAAELPIAGFVDSVPGFALLGLAIIVAESGPLDAYASKSKLWRRWGLGVAEDGRCQRLQRGVEESKKQGFSPRRRTVIWMLTTASMMKRSRYYDVYVARREVERQRTPVKAASNARAHRYAEKRLLKDLWVAWRGSAHRRGVGVSPAEQTSALRPPETCGRDTDTMTIQEAAEHPFAERPVVKCRLHETTADRGRILSAARPTQNRPDSCSFSIPLNSGQAAQGRL